MTDLRTFLDSHPGPVDLGSDTYEVAGTVVVNRPIHGQGATIHQSASSDRNASILRLVGKDYALTGIVHLIGARPKGTPYISAIEGQHGLEVAGAGNVKCEEGWTVSNVYGDGVYIGKDRHDGHWASWVSFRNIILDEIGRQAMTVAAGIIIGFHGNVVYANRSVLDIEPPGSDWGAEYIVADLEVHSPNGAVLADKGAGANNVHDIYVHAAVHGRQWSATVLPPLGTRRQNFKLTGSGGGISHSTPIRLHHVDGVHVDITQRIDPGVAQVLYDDCTGVY